MADGDPSLEKKSDGFVIYKLQAKEDGTLSFNLSLTHRSFLVFLAGRGGETSYDYDKLKPETAQHMKLLVEMGLLSESVYLGMRHTCVLLRLTDVGRNVIPLIEADFAIAHGAQ